MTTQAPTTEVATESTTSVEKLHNQYDSVSSEGTFYNLEKIKKENYQILVQEVQGFYISGELFY